MTATLSIPEVELMPAGNEMTLRSKDLHSGQPTSVAEFRENTDHLTAGLLGLTIYGEVAQC